IGSFYSSVQIHRGTGIQTNHSRYQHTAFQNKFVTIFRKGDTLQKTLHHVVPHQELGVRRFFLERLRIRSFNCLAVFIIKAPPNTAAEFFLPGTYRHTASMSAGLCLFFWHTSLMPLEKSASPCCSCCGAGRRWCAPGHRQELYAQM